MDDTNKARALNTLKDAYAQAERTLRPPTRDERSSMHTLAEAQYMPAFDFFEVCLNAKEWGWRYDAICCIGFHYMFSASHPVVQKMQHLLQTDQDSFGFVRIAAASVLGIRSSWPDQTLLETLVTEQDPDVQAAIYDAVLTLAGVPFTTIQHERQRVEQHEIQPSLAEVQRVLSEVGLNNY